MVAAAAVVFVPREAEEPVTLPQSPMPGRLLVGFQDDATFRWAADRGEMLDRARHAGISVVRTTVVWRDAAPTRPTEPADSFDPAYRLDDVDDLVRSAQQRGIELLVTIWGTPGWANGERGRTAHRGSPATSRTSRRHSPTAIRVGMPATQRCASSRRGTSRTSSSSSHRNSMPRVARSARSCTRRSREPYTTV
jgi:hypothetical protein